MALWIFFAGAEFIGGLFHSLPVEWFFMNAQHQSLA
jgi:hypothetical protein